MDESVENRLYAAIRIEIIESIERQLSPMSYFNQSGSQAKMEYESGSVLLGAESQFAKPDNRIAICASILCYRRRNVVATNCLLVDTEFTEKSEAEKYEKWKWAMTSQHVKMP